MIDTRVVECSADALECYRCPRWSLPQCNIRNDRLAKSPPPGAEATGRASLVMIAPLIKPSLLDNIMVGAPP